jgi:adenylate cyclase class 2
MDDTHEDAATRHHVVPYTAAYLSVELEPLRANLATLPATQRSPRSLVVRKIFAGSALGPHHRLLAVVEPERAFLTLHRTPGPRPEKELHTIETDQSGANAVAKILGQLGVRQQHYWECYHEEWSIGDLTFKIETWPDLPTLLRIGGPDEAAVRRAAKRLHLPDSAAHSGSIEDIYLAATGRNVRTEATLLFPREMIGSSVPASPPVVGDWDAR